MKTASCLSLCFASIVLTTGLAIPALGQDPQALFGTNKPASAPKAAAPKPAAPATKPAPASPTKAAAASAVKPTASRRAATQGGTVHRAPAGGGAAHSASVRAGGQPPASPAAVQAYCNRVWGKVQTNWDLPTGKNHVILGVDVDSSGNVTSTKASSQPKNPDAEAKAQEALTKAQPLDPLPTGLPWAHLTITFTSTSDPHGDSNSGGTVKLEYNPGAAPPTSAPAADAAPGATAPAQ